MERDMYGIGEVARRSGLTVSALRFYDGEGVIVPAYVDPRSGYRSYGDKEVGDARIVARLRRVGMPVVAIRRLIAQQHDAAVVAEILDRHLARLEGGLADARREISTVRTQLDRMENPMTTTPTTAALDGARLAEALRSVRYAAGNDPELPMLCGVLVQIGVDAVTVVATDRYRLAVAAAPVEGVAGPAAEILAPLDLIDQMIAALSDRSGTVEVSVDGGVLAVGGHGITRLSATGLDHTFPDYRRLLATTASDRVVIDAPRARAALANAPSRLIARSGEHPDHTVVAIALDGSGDLGFGPVADGDGRVLVNREYLLQALDAAGTGQLTLELDGPVAPLVIRSDRESDVAMLMPTQVS